jgi:hypothetical protein
VGLIKSSVVDPDQVPPDSDVFDLLDPNPDQLIQDMNPDPDPSINEQK